MGNGTSDARSNAIPQFSPNHPFVDPRANQIFPQTYPPPIPQLVAPPPLDASGYPPEVFAELSRAAALSGYHIPGSHDILPYPMFGIPPPLYGVRHLR